MDFNIEIRKKQLESLDQFLTSSRDKVQSILDCLGWTVDKIEEEKLFVNCPYNAGHKVPADKIEDHIDRCKVKNAGYDISEKFLSEPGNHSEEGSIKLDTIKKIEVLSQAIMQTPYFQTAWNGQDPDPQTYSRMMTTFSRDERLALYNYCVSNTKGCPELPEFDTSIATKKDGSTSYTEEALLSFERDIKRRSVKYKPIHTNHKNYKEVLREVINSQMQQYNDWLAHGSDSARGPHTPERSEEVRIDEKPEETEEMINQDETYELDDRPRSSITRVSNYSSSSRSSYKRREGSSRHYSHEREREYHNQEYYESKYSRYNSINKYTHYEEDSQESNNISQVSASVKSENMDSLYENYEDISRNHSRDSSIHSSHKYRERSERDYDKKRKSRSTSCDRKMKKHRKHKTRSRDRSREYKSHKRDKKTRDHSKKREKYRDT